MSRYRSSGFAGFGIGGGWTPAVKTLIIACVVGFSLQIFDQFAGAPSFTSKFGLVPALVTHKFYVWQLITYIFLHGGFFHILFNMFALWMFGTPLEQTWGSRRFLRFYVICGVGAGFIILLWNSITTEPSVVTLGASGAIYGLLLAYGVIFKDRPILMWFLFPVPSRWFVIITGALVLWASITDPTGGVAHLAHLGGMAFGYVYLKFGPRGGSGLWLDLKYRYTRWRLNRQRRRFNVHSGGRSAPPGGWTH